MVAVSITHEDQDAARHMLALALVLEGQRRDEAARLCGMDRQTPRDWVHRCNAGSGGFSRRSSGTTISQPSPRHGGDRWVLLRQRQLS